MTGDKVDLEFVRETWEVSSNVSDYAAAVEKVGLWESEWLLVSKYFSEDAQILDIGCGAGRTTIALYRLGYLNVQGVDSSNGMIERAVALTEKAGCPIPFEVGDAINLRYEDETFDGGLFSAQGFMCIPGVKRRLQALKEVRRVLRPGGHFVFTTHDRRAAPEFASFWDEEKARWEKGTQDQRLLEFGDRIVVDSGTWTYVHIPARDEVARIVQEAGMVVVEDLMRSELSRESDAVQWFSTDCRMWVVRRPMRFPYRRSSCHDGHRPESRVEQRAPAASAVQVGGCGRGHRKSPS